MLGFLLNGTPVAVRIVNWRSRHLIRDDLQALVDRDVSKTFMSKYRVGDVKFTIRYQYLVISRSGTSNIFQMEPV